MNSSYDVITIGSGHNGLVAAAYLAKAGKKVLVLERNDWIGGGVVTRELTLPGFRHDQHSMAHIFIQANPLLVNDELGLLGKYGLKYLHPEIPMISVFPDGQTLALYCDRERNYQEIARFSPADAERYRAFSERGAAYLPALTGTLYSPPAPIGAMYAMMDQSREGREIMQVMQRSAYDIVMESFEDERVRLHFLRMVSENLTGPEEKGTGIGLFMFLAFLEKYGIGVAEGGSGKLSEALVACIEDHGGEVETGVAVAKVLVKAGRASGVRCEDGRELVARDAVIGAIHPHLLPKFVEGLDPFVASTAERVELSANCVFTIHAALDEPLRFKAGEHVGKAMMIELLPPDIATLRGHFDDLRYGRLPSHSLIGLGSVSNIDPSRAPAGKATMHAWDYVPYEHPDGGAQAWASHKQAFAESMLSKMQAYIPNLDADMILAMHCDSPVDMERTSASFRRGDIHGVAPYLYQFGAHRPTPELGNNTVPGVERLYLVGPFQHPGGGVFGAGRGTAIRMFDDMDMNFDAVIA
ncbi:MAG: NAD(P)/FAD-dependent oxidoreductase [Pseudomonadales bacterium]|nr:NAD(P)/FAD-dependent oxidoreductase [Pseudomonadales bacterium]